MNKLIVIGCPGSGKSTLSTKLGEMLGIPVHHLDDWQHLSPKEFREIQDELMKKNEWILDGNFTKSIDNRAAKADVIIFLDYSKWLVYGRVMKRYLVDFKNIITSFFNTWGILVYIWNFPRAEIMSILEKHKRGRMILIFSNQKKRATFS